MVLRVPLGGYGSSARMAITTLLFDLDDTLIPQDAVDQAALLATARIAAPDRDIHADSLVRAAGDHGRLLWHTAATAPLCESLGISWTEGLWAEFRGDDPQFSALRAWAAEYRHLTWTRALATQGVMDAALACSLAAAFPRERRRRQTVFPEAEAVLDGLRKRYRLGLITNGASCLQREKLDASGLGSYFETVIVSGEVGVGKPDARIFTLALERLNVPAHEAVMVGDNPVRDIAGAHNARLWAVWVNRDGRVLHEAEPTAHGEIARLHQLEAFIEKCDVGLHAL